MSVPATATPAATPTGPVTASMNDCRRARRAGCAAKLGGDLARPSQVLQLDWAELRIRPKIAGRERRIYALVRPLPYSGAQSAHFSFEMTLESLLEGHVRLFESSRRSRSESRR
jgi:transposase